MANTGYSYAYACPSALDEPGRRLGLQTSGGQALVSPGPHPRFFTGFLAQPGAAAAGLLAVARVAQERYIHSPSELIARDPVVTCNGDRLRFESFSGCGGVYARLDVLSGALDGEVHDRGTTNVDVNEPLRRALARVGGGDPLHLAVGPDELAVTTLDGREVEKKVPLPPRWLRGFAETQVIMARCDLRAELTATEAVRFLRSLPAGSAGGSTGTRVARGRWRGAQWVVPASRGVRIDTEPVPGAVCLAGAHRLGALAPLLRYVRGLRVYGPVVTAGSLPCASAWEVGLPGMRLTLGLSPEAHRGFSGEGAVLEALAAGADGDADLIGALLAFEPRVETDSLAERSGLTVPRVREALVRLGTTGRVGYDLAEAAYFHRELPYDPGRAERDNPRLRDARALVAAGAVTVDGDLVTVWVTDHARQVRFAPGGGASCTCDWWQKYRDSRGSCKHVLAARMARDGTAALGGGSPPAGRATGASSAAAPVPTGSAASRTGDPR